MNSVHPRLLHAANAQLCAGVATAAPSRCVVRSHPPERNNPLWFRSLVDQHTGEVNDYTRRAAAAAAARRERDFQGQKALLFFPPPCICLLASGAPHHDFHYECMSNDDKGNAEKCITYPLINVSSTLVKGLIRSVLM